MSREVDERIVQMRFDNNQFENGVKTSLSTLDKLKSALNFGKTSSSLEDLANSMKGLNFGGAISGIESLSQHFSTFGVIGDQILRNIGNKISEFAFRTTALVKNLTFDQIGAGFGKFEELTKNTATLVGQGYGLDLIEAQLERLLWFTDETSYNFTDMVQNIGKFTATGQNLEESVTAMEGIATWAALSGQSAQTASRAMYQLSQAMGAGVMRREDYRSIQNASMDTEEFRQKALDAGVALGTLKKNADGTYTSIVEGAKSSTFSIGQFAEHLTEDQWFTSKVMMKVFNDYSAAVDEIYEYAEAHGITASEAMEELNGQVDEFGLKAFKAAQEARSWGDVIDSLKDAVSTGWMQTWKLVFGNYEEATSLWTSLANSLYDVFMFGTDQRNSFLEFWRNIGGREKLVNAVTGSIEKFADVLNNIEFPFQSAIEEQNRLFDAFNEAKSLADARGVNLGSDTAPMAEGMEKLYDIFNKFGHIKSGVGAVFEIFGQAFTAIKDTLKPLADFLPKVGGKLLDVAVNLSDWAVKIKEAAEKTQFFISVFKTLSDAFAPLATFVGDTIMDFLDYLKDLTKIDEASKKIDEFAEKVSPLAGIFNGIKTFLGSFVKFMTGTISMIKPIFDGLGTVITTFFESIGKALSRGDIKTAASIINGLFAGKIVTDIAKLTGTLNKAGDSIVDFLTIITSKLGGNKDKASEMLENVMVLAKAFGILAVSMFLISTIEPLKMLEVFGAMELMVHMLTKTAKAINELKSENWQDSLGNFFNTLSMGSIATAVLTLSVAAKILSTLDVPGMIKAAIGIGVMMAELYFAMKYMTTDASESKKAIGGLIGFAASMVILAIALKKLGDMEPDKLALGLTGMAFILLELTIFTHFKAENFNAAGFITTALALILICNAVKQLGRMDPNGLANGLAGMMFVMAELLIFAGLGKALGNSMIATAAALLIMSVAITAIALALAVLAQFDFTTLAAGIGALGGALLLLIVFGMAGSIVGVGMLAAAAALFIMSAALLMFTPALLALSSIPFESMLVALFGIAAAFTALTVAATLMSPFIPALLWMAVALIALGAAAIVAGLGLQSLALGLMAIGEIIKDLNLFMVSAIASVVKGVGAIFKAIGGLIKGSIDESKQALEDADFETPINNNLDRTEKSVKKRSREMSEVAASGMVEGRPAWDKAGDTVAGSALDRMYDYLPSTEVAGIDLSKAGADGFSSLTDLYGDASDMNMEEIMNSMYGSVPGIQQAGVTVGTAGANGVSSTWRIYHTSGANNSTAAAEGIKANAQQISNAAYNAARDAARKMDQYDTAKSSGANTARGYADGLNAEKWRVQVAADSIAEIVNNRITSYNLIASPSKLLAQTGKYMDMGLAKGLMDNLGLVSKAADILAMAPNNAIMGAGRYMSGASSVFANSVLMAIGRVNDVITNSADALTIRPVLDMTNVNSSLSGINTSFNAQKVSLAAASMEINNEYSQLDRLVDMTAQIYRQLQNGQDLYLDENILAGRINRRLGLL